MEQFKLELIKLNTLKTQCSQIEAEILKLTEFLYQQYKCSYLRVCSHCGQDGSDTILECDKLQREVYANDCDILRCVHANIIKKHT